MVLANKLAGVGPSAATSPAGAPISMNLHNVAPWERILRCGIGVAMLALGWAGVVPGLGGASLQLFGWFPLVTGLIGWSPIYSMLGVSTRRGPVAAPDERSPPERAGDDGAEGNDDRITSRGP